MSPSPGDHPDRTIPEWLDPQNLHGRLYYLFLKAVDGHTLPNPFVVGKSIEKHAGKIEGAFFDQVRKWYVLKVRNKDQGRHLTLLNKLVDGTSVEIGRHPNLNQRKFVVRCKEADGMSEQELLTELSPQKITDVRRITKKTATGIVETPTLVLTINSTIIPEHVNFGLLRVRTRVYVPQPLLCRLCFSYGHPKKRCPNERACSVCSSTAHDSSTCSGPKFCKTCKSPDHSPSDRNCPKWMEESAALRISVEQNISITTARQQVRNSNNINSYAKVTRYGNCPNKTNHPAQIHQQHHQQQEHEKANKQQQQKRDRTTSATRPSDLLLSATADSPPRKKSPSRPIRSPTAELSIEPIETNSPSDSTTICTATEQTSSSKTSTPSHHPPPLNPFQPPQPPSFKLKINKPPGT